MLSVRSICFLVVVGISSDLVPSFIGQYLHGFSLTIWVVDWVCVVAMAQSHFMIGTLTVILLLVFVLIELCTVVLDRGICICTTGRSTGG